MMQCPNTIAKMLMIKPKVYLAGPVTGLTKSAAGNWRHDVKIWLESFDVDSIDPMRMMPDGMTDDTVLLDNMEGACSASDPSAVLARCHWDLQRCDAVLAYMSGAETASIGTSMELAWAVAYNKPIIIVDEAGSPHDHCMIRSATPYFYRSLDEAVDVIWKLFA